MASIREVARLAKVAPSTVSRALNGSGYVAEETKEQILQAVLDLDYVPNQWIRNLYRQKTGIIGVVAPELIHPYFSSLFSCLETELHKYGYNMMICNTSGKKGIEREYLDTLERNLFDGMIIGAAFLPDEYYQKVEKPILSLDRMIEGIPLVTSDHRQGGQLAASKLLEAGCCNVLQLSDPYALNIASARSGIEFIKEMKNQDAKVTSATFLWEDVIDYEKAMARAKEILTAYPALDGILANDLCAAAFLKIAKEMDKNVPDDLKIISYDGTFVTDFNYRSMDTIVQDVNQLSKEAVQVLLRLINKQPLTQTEIYVPVHYKKGETI